MLISAKVVFRGVFGGRRAVVMPWPEALVKAFKAHRFEKVLDISSDWKGALGEIKSGRQIASARRRRSRGYTV